MSITTEEQGKISVPFEDRIRRDRKYKVYWAAFLSNIGLLVWGLISADNFVELQIFVFGLYMAGNGFEHMSTAWRARGESRPG